MHLCLSLWFLVFLCGTTIESKQNTVSRNLGKFLDKIADGIHVPEVSFKGETGKLTDVQIHFVNMAKTVDGLKSFGFELDLNVSKISLGGKYDFWEIQLPGSLPVYGKGDFEIALNGFNEKLSVEAVRNFVEEKFDVRITEFEVKLENSTIEFENLMNDPSLSEFLNRLISILLPDFVEIFSQEGRILLVSAIENGLNEIFKCIQTESLTGKLDECIRNVLFGMIKADPFEN